MRLTKRKRRVVLHLDRGPSIEGILIRRRPMYVLEVPAVRMSETDTQSLDGYVEVEPARVTFFEVLTR